MRSSLLLLVVLAVASSVVGGSEARLRTQQHSHRFLVAQALVRGLRGTPAAGQGWLLERVAWQERINPYFVVGAAGTESSVWRAPCSSNPKNGWGLSSCGSGWYVPYFRSWESAFRFFARFVHRQWPSARDVFSLSGYSACDSCWGPKTASWMRQLFGNVSTGLAYP